jgi:uncharacterized protein YbcI
MDKPKVDLAQQIAQAARAFERQRTGHGPRSVTVVMSDDVLVITLHGALSQAERNLAGNPDGAAPASGISPPAFRHERSDRRVRRSRPAAAP